MGSQYSSCVLDWLASLQLAGTCVRCLSSSSQHYVSLRRVHSSILLSWELLATYGRGCVQPTDHVFSANGQESAALPGSVQAAHFMNS